MEYFNVFPDEILDNLKEELLDNSEDDLEVSLPKNYSDILVVIKLNLWQLFSQKKSINDFTKIKLSEIVDDLISVYKLKSLLSSNPIIPAYFCKAPVPYHRKMEMILKKYSSRVYKEILEATPIRYDKLGNPMADPRLMEVKLKVLHTIEDRLLGLPVQKQELDIKSKNINYDASIGINGDNIIPDIKEIDNKIKELLQKNEVKQLVEIDE